MIVGFGGKVCRGFAAPGIGYENLTAFILIITDLGEGEHKVRLYKVRPYVRTPSWG